MTYEEWLRIGMDAGFCGPAVCATHDGIPTSAEEDEAGEDTGEPPCMHVLRLYPSDEVKAAVEANHAPSVWRKQEVPS